jgi:hypothetical protein
LPIKLYIVKPNEFSTTLLYDPNKPATRLLGGDRYDDEGNCYKSGVLGKVPCLAPEGSILLPRAHLAPPHGTM